MLAPYFHQDQAITSPTALAVWTAQASLPEATLKANSSPVQGLGVGQLCYQEEESASIPTDFTKLGGKGRVYGYFSSILLNAQAWASIRLGIKCQFCHFLII